MYFWDLLRGLIFGEFRDFFPPRRFGFNQIGF
jgi:hypothetical protein